MANTMTKTLLTIAVLALTAGCEFTQDNGTTVTSNTGNSVTTPPDFVVTPVAPTTPVSTGGDNTAQNLPPSVDYMEEGFLINDGATKTKDAAVQLHLITLNRNQMKIGTAQDCSDGSWEPYAEFETFTLPLANAMNTVSVQYMDYDNRTTTCYRQSILDDAQGPDILFSAYPAATLNEGSVANIVATVTDTLGTTKDVTCSLNQISKPCHDGRNEIAISQLPVGDYTFAVHAEDDLGNVSDKSVTWKVVSQYKTLEQSITINNYKKVDILIVIDNSGSMAFEQKSMASRTGHLLSVLSGLDYQIAVTTTDPRNITLGDGRFIPISGANGQYILDSSTPQAVAQTRLSNTLQRPETGSGTEESINAVYRVVQRYNSNDQNARSFFRQGAQFAVLVISDEDESANGVSNDPQNLLNLLQTSFQGQKMFSFNSIITVPGDTACKAGEGYAYGDRYAAFSKLTGGIIGSVCEMDYTPQVTQIAQNMRDLLKTMTLSCTPVSGQPITIKKDGVAMTSSYTVEGVNLKFATELDPGNYTVDYSCLKN